VDYVLLIVGAALGVLGVLAKKKDEPLTPAQRGILGLLSLSLTFGLIQTHQKNKAAAQATEERDRQEAALNSELKDAKAQTKHAEDLLYEQSKVNLFAALSNAPPVHHFGFSALHISREYGVESSGDDSAGRLRTLVGDDPALAKDFVEAHFSLHMTSYGGDLNLTIHPGGPLLGTGFFDFEKNNVLYSIRMKDRIDVNVRSSAAGFGNAAIVLRDLQPGFAFAHLTVTFRTPPSDAAIAKLKKQWNDSLGDAIGTVELLQSSTFAVRVNGKMTEPQFDGNVITATWEITSEPHLYLMAF